MEYVNALSKFVNVTVYRDGKVYECKFENGGKTQEPLKVIGECAEERTGTTVTFKADPEIFRETTVYDYEILKQRVRELAFLNKDLRLTLTDERVEPNLKESFMYEGGISEYVRYLNKAKTPIHDEIIHLEGEDSGVMFEVAMQYNTGFNENIRALGDFGSRLYHIKAID